MQYFDEPTSSFSETNHSILEALMAIEELPSHPPLFFKDAVALKDAVAMKDALLPSTPAYGLDIWVNENVEGALHVDEEPIADGFLATAIQPPAALTLPAAEKHIEYPIDMPDIHVSNVVCTTSIGCVLDLEHCGKHLKNSYRTRFPALFVRLSKPAITLLLYASGSINSTGARTYEENVLGITRMVKSLQKLGYASAQVGNISIENIVANFEMGFKVNITKLASHPDHQPYCETQAKFPCINYRIRNISPQITLRLFRLGRGHAAPLNPLLFHFVLLIVVFFFSNGKGLCQAAKTLENVYLATSYIVPVLYLFKQRKNDPVDSNTLISLF